MKTRNGKQFWVFDNSGETLDRYSILTNDGDVCAASADPFLGIGQFSHNICDKYAISYGVNWRKRLDEKKITKQEIKDYLKEARQLGLNWLGKEIKSVKQLPENLVRYIEQVNQ
jgi:hypothetical protein